MPHRATQFAAGHYYHLYNRGAGRQPIFKEEENYLFLLRMVKKYVDQLHIAVIAYCFMPNHYHFLLRQDGEEPAGLLIQRIFNSYTKAFNKRYHHTGTLFEGRYQSIRVDKTEYLFHLCRYIHANPVKAGIVSHLEEWSFSNYPEWIETHDSMLVDREFIEENFPQRTRYRQFVMDYLNGLDELPEGIEPYLLDNR